MCALYRSSLNSVIKIESNRHSLYHILRTCRLISIILPEFLSVLVFVLWLLCIVDIFHDVAGVSQLSRVYNP